MKQVAVRDVSIGSGELVLIAGPCVIESREHTLFMAESLAEIASRTGVPLIFKASFDKANRSSISSYRGPGLEKGLEILAEVKEGLGLPVITDIHEPRQAAAAASWWMSSRSPPFSAGRPISFLPQERPGFLSTSKKGSSWRPGI